MSAYLSGLDSLIEDQELENETRFTTSNNRCYLSKIPFDEFADHVHKVMYIAGEEIGDFARTEHRVNTKFIVEWTKL